MSRLLPARIDNRYRGHVLALWLFVPVALQRVALGLTHLLRADGGAQSISTIPLDTYPPSAAQNVIGLFARMGVEQLLFGFLCLLVLLRYRALIPLMYLLIVVHYLVSRVAGRSSRWCWREPRERKPRPWSSRCFASWAWSCP